MRHATLIVVWLSVASVLMALKSYAASSSPNWEVAYHSVVPLGQDAVLLRPGSHLLSFEAVAESIDFEGWHRGDAGNLLLSADGNPVVRYPRFVDFLVTILAKPKTSSKPIPGLEPFLVDCESQCTQDPNDLLNVQFRIRIFRALQVTVLEPKVVKLEGELANGRMYRVSFDLGEVPLTDRIVLEVLSPSGERLTKFHLDM